MQRETGVRLDWPHEPVKEWNPQVGIHSDGHSREKAGTLDDGMGEGGLEQRAGLKVPEGSSVNQTSEYPGAGL